jgi:hypothetical protein
LKYQVLARRERHVYSGGQPFSKEYLLTTKSNTLEHSSSGVA